MQVKDLDEGVRSTVGTRLLQLTLKELFSWRFMQTDPNWCGVQPLHGNSCKDKNPTVRARLTLCVRSAVCTKCCRHLLAAARGNFLYDETTGRINLIDFGAAREYPAAFVGDYLEMVMGCANKDREQVIQRSTRLGFLTGMHVQQECVCASVGQQTVV